MAINSINSKSHNSGFTLIELVVVIVILGILAATALPKFVNLGEDARKASLQSLKGALESAARVGYSLCFSSPATCNTQLDSYPRINVSVTRNGSIYDFHFGYPIPPDEAWNAANGFKKGIDTYIDFTGFTRQPYVGGSVQAVYTKDGAPKPEECKVIYDFPNKHAAGPLVVSVVDTGC